MTEFSFLVKLFLEASVIVLVSREDHSRSFVHLLKMPMTYRHNKGGERSASDGLICSLLFAFPVLLCFLIIKTTNKHLTKIFIEKFHGN